jgi:16S rRNA (adenine1518-N6/adenine1519-N6)-dimethyltransferase
VVYSGGIRLKKKFGQHFLRDPQVMNSMFNAVKEELCDARVLEIGCGDGFLTRLILTHPIRQLWVFEIDHEWTTFVTKNILDNRLIIFNEDILQINCDRLVPYAPWLLLANLPYQITFPILYRIQTYRSLFTHIVVMIQEEVAQKLVKRTGRGYGFPALFFQHYFTVTLLDAVPIHAFVPEPKVQSRLIHLKPRTIVHPIPEEAEFWQFVKRCFQQPRRTLKNNLMQTHYNLPDIYANLRAQQMNMEDLRTLWDIIRHDKGSKNL